MLKLTIKILSVTLVFLLVLTVSATFYKYYIAKDYIVETEVDCDTELESCFVYICDSLYEECTGDLEVDTWYYKYFYRMAYNIPDCDPNDEACSALVCEEGEEGCEFETCTPEAAIERDLGTECSN